MPDNYTQDLWHPGSATPATTRERGEDVTRNNAASPRFN